MSLEGNDMRPSLSNGSCSILENNANLAFRNSGENGLALEKRSERFCNMSIPDPSIALVPSSEG
jgi:hypothetical protein